MWRNESCDWSRSEQILQRRRLSDGRMKESHLVQLSMRGLPYQFPTPGATTDA